MNFNKKYKKLWKAWEILSFIIFLFTPDQRGDVIKELVIFLLILKNIIKVVYKCESFN